MAKNIYENHLAKIKELRKLRDKEELVRYTQQLSKRVNQRLYRLEKAEKGLKESAYYFAQKETGKEKPRYTTSEKKLNELSEQELIDRLVKLNQKLVSKTSTSRGLEELAKFRTTQSIYASESKKFQTMLEESDLTEKDFRKFLEMGGGKLMNSKYLDSEQIREDWLEVTKSGKVSSEEFINALNEFIERADEDEDYLKVIRDLKNLAEG